MTNWIMKQCEGTKLGTKTLGVAGVIYVASYVSGYVCFKPYLEDLTDLEKMNKAYRNWYITNGVIGVAAGAFWVWNNWNKITKK